MCHYRSNYFQKSSIHSLNNSILLRDAINSRVIALKARASGSVVHTYHSRDRIGGHPVSRDIRRALWKLPSGKCGDGMGRMPLFCGMKVMISDNVAFSHRAVNGTEATVHKIMYRTDEEARRYAVLVYVFVLVTISHRVSQSSSLRFRGSVKVDVTCV